MVIQHNLSAMMANRMFGIVNIDKSKKAEKLSSGYRINRAADDAAGLAISEKMRREIRGLTQGSQNIQEGVSLCQVADGYLQEVHEMIQRINELAVKGANETLTDTDRSYLNSECQAIKEEMKRIFDSATYNEIPIFHVPYMPEVEPSPEPYDIQLFYSSSGQIGGLEFNNVRYNIEELRNIPASQGQSMKLDANGIATEDQEVKFTLNYPAGEEVVLKLNKGESLADVKRNYSWTADDTGIYVNKVLAARWSELDPPVASGANSGGMRSFNYKGSKISFEVGEGDEMSDIKNGINGDGFTTASTWDISVAGATSRSIAPIVGNSSTRVAVTSANMNEINDKYYISATADGLAITRTEADGTGATTTSRTAWSSFTDTATGGKPIVDWGLDSDSNDSSQVSFDNDATYHYTSPDSNVRIQYYFKLADAASKPEVISALDGTEITGNIVCPTETTSSNPSLYIYDKQIDGGSSGNNDKAFEMQVLYGRTFGSSSETLGGNVTWNKTKLSTGATTYSNSSRTTNVADATTNTMKYYRMDTGTVDGEGNAVYKYYKVNEAKHVITYDREDTNVSSWSEDYKLDYTGSLGIATMQGVTGSTVTINLSKTDITTYKSQESYTKYGTSEEITDLSGFSDDQLNGMETLTSDQVNDRYDSSRKYDEHPITTVPGTSSTTQGSVKVTNGNSVYRTNGNFTKTGVDADKYAFKFTHSITYNDIYNLSGSGSSTIATKAKGEAYRNFTPQSKSPSLAEPDFLSIIVNPPEKHCIIQCAPDVEDQHEIDMVWSPLNLSIAGISGADLSTASRCLASIEIAKESLNIISEERTTFGSYHNRFEHAIKNTDNTVENTQASESRIRDTEMARTMSDYSNAEIIAQAGQMMIAQANQTPQGVLNLLQ